MTKHARIIDDVAVDVVDGDPTTFFTADLAAEFVPVPDNIVPGWRLDDGTWTAPVISETPISEPLPLRRTVFTPPEFLLLFTAAERVAIRAARPTNPVIADWLAILEDPRLSEVDVTRQSTRDGLDYLASENLITPARAAEIGTGAAL